MIVRDYKLPADYTVKETLFKFSGQVNVFSEDNNSHQSGTIPPPLLIWQQAMKDYRIDTAMQSADWPLRFLHALPAKNGWKWEIKQESDHQSITEWSQIIDLTTMASGLSDIPRGNISLTLPIRTYEEKSKTVGGLLWWRDQENRINMQCELCGIFFTKLYNLLKEVETAGYSFLVEQISIILAKDSKSKIATLTPTLHSDTYYGYRETALCSLAETNFSRFEGTLFAPSVRMNSLEQHRPIDLEKMLHLLKDEPIIEAKSGDVVLYDGMIGRDGRSSTANGVPHISPDTPGHSSRLLILMRAIKIT